MSRILGIFDGTHNSGAAIIEDGVIVAACDTERFTRQKGAGGFPTEAIHGCLQLAKLSLSQIDKVAFAGWINPNPILRLNRTIQKKWQLDSDKFYAPTAWFSNWIQFHSPFPYLHPKSGPLWRISENILKKILRQQLRSQLQWNVSSIDLHEHHLAHAATAHFGSGFKESLTVVADGIGDGLSFSIWLGNETSLQKCFELPYPHSLGLLYASFTGFLGFKPFRHEGKLTGMAALGNSENIPIAFPFTGDFPNRRFTQQFPLYKWLESFEEYTPEDICAWLQKGVESEILGILSWHIQQFGSRPIALAGGLFANVALNGRISEEINPSEFFVFPNMGDGGLSVGAAYLSFSKEGKRPPSIDTMMVGSAIENITIAIEEFAKTHKLHAIQLSAENVVEKVCSTLANGGLVARAYDKMEYGPRALGNRSILCRASNPDIHSILNSKLQRSEFMPFAPILRADNIDRWVIANPCAKNPMEWMTVTVQATDELQRVCPAIVHVDNSLRPQIVYQHKQPTLWAVLEQFEKLTGEPAVINTSFNIHEEPIIRTAEEALRGFWNAGLDYLWINDWWIERNK